MNENISFRHFKTILRSKGISIAELAKKLGVKSQGISAIATGIRQPKTDLLARICFILHCYPSEVVEFDGINVNEDYFKKENREPLPSEATGEVSYRPLWYFLDDYLVEHEGKTANDLFDQIEPPRRLKGYKAPVKEYYQKAVEARFGEGYKSERKNRTDYSKGLPAMTRVKLRNDRALNLEVIYEICRKLGCSIDFVMSYK
jgi:DNA-binding Xre family transcriptional regulator